MKRTHRAGMQTMCEASRADIMKMMDWYVAREMDGAFLGFKAHPSGNAKVLAVAHVDYLKSGRVHKNNRKVIVSSALDDRAGVYIALGMLDDYGVEVDVLLTDEEEMGNSTIPMFGAGMLKKYNWIVQLDRRGTDAVTYGYTELEPFLEDFWEVESGTCSDIAYLEDICPVSAFNLGVGYHREHHEDCHLIYRQLHRQLCKLKEFYDLYHDVRMERKHFDGELWDVPIPPRPVYTPKQAVGFAPQPWKRERCGWCSSDLPAKPMVTAWGTELCTACYDDWHGTKKGRAEKFEDTLTWCADCEMATDSPRVIKGKSYCVDCATLAEVMESMDD